MNPKHFFIILLCSTSIISVQAQQLPAVPGQDLSKGKFSVLFPSSKQLADQSSNISVYDYPLMDEPDSILMEAVDGSKTKDFFQYSDGNATQITSMLPGLEDTWENYERLNVDYNSENYPDTITNYVWTGTTWESDSKISYSYNENGKVISSTGYGWSPLGWEALYFVQYAYWQDGDTTEMISQVSPDNTTWSNIQKLRYAYDNDDKIIMQETYIWNDIAWEKLVRKSVTFNTNGRETQWNELYYAAEPFYMRYDFSYNINQKIDKINITVSAGYDIDYMTLTYDYSGASAIHNMDYSNVSVVVKDSHLSLISPFAETVFVYSYTGMLLQRAEKPVGEFILPISGQSGLYIVKGDTGWVKKVMK